MISIKEIELAQEEWGKGVVRLGQLKDKTQESRAYAESFLSRLYCFGESKVLFKPTKAYQNPFRLSQKAALSYFIGGDPDFSEDSGFALKPWLAVHFENACIRIDNNMATAMGHYSFTDTKEEILLVEYTFGYCRKTDEEPLKIWLHHSSLPFDPCNKPT